MERPPRRPNPHALRQGELPLAGSDSPVYTQPIVLVGDIEGSTGVRSGRKPFLAAGSAAGQEVLAAALAC